MIGTICSRAGIRRTLVERISRIGSVQANANAGFQFKGSNLRKKNECISSQLQRHYSMTVPVQEDATVSITYVEADGTEKTVQAKIGAHLLDVAHDNDIELEGACGGELACSTCHLIFDQDVYDTLPEKDEEEDDMLDLAYEVTETSRLGCQIKVRQEYDGIKVQIPDDGF